MKYETHFMRVFNTHMQKTRSWNRSVRS